MATKLPLAVRKNVKDEYDSKKGELEATISELFKEKWTFNFDIPAIWANAKDGYAKDRTGAMLAAYIHGLEWQGKRFVEKYGDDGLAALNAAASSHTITLELDESKRFSYCGCDIKDGVVRLLYSPGNLGVNIDGAASSLDKAVDEAEKSGASAGGQDGLYFVARASIKAKWEPEAPALEKRLQDMVKMPSLKFEPGFAEVAKAMCEAGKDVGRDNWEEYMGQVVFSYFKGLEYNMERKEFGTDDMLQEGFQDGISSGLIGFRIVKKLERNSYNEVVIENGKLWLQTTPQNWWVNVDAMGDDLINLL